MTKKQKTRKASAVEGRDPCAATVAPHDPKRQVSEIERLVLRHKWLEADQSYRAAIADTDKEEDRLLAIHDVELQKIESEARDSSPIPFKTFPRCWNSSPIGPETGT